MPDIHADRVLILDFGAQYTQLIARRVRELGVYCEIYACDVDGAEMRALRRGHHSFRRPRIGVRRQGPGGPAEVFELGVPVLGICYGMQTMAAQLGGQVELSSHREFGARKSGRPPTRGCSTDSKTIATPKAGACSMCG
jgi:GMP synthase (glutamine-hydrolysing)